MDRFSPRSLRHEYDLYIEDEIEDYKNSISRTALLKIGDEAVAALQDQMQFAMNELLICDEVDKIIRKRIRLPSYTTWRRKYLKRLEELAEFKRPEHWGVPADSAVVREFHFPAEAKVLVAGREAAGTALYLAAQGYSVTAVDPGNLTEVTQHEDAVHLPGKVATVPVSLSDWHPDEPLNAVVCTPAAFAGLTPAQRAKVIAVLQSATRDGGVHLVDTIIAGRAEPSLSELRKSYKGWDISVVDDGVKSRSFVARKAVA